MNREMEKETDFKKYLEGLPLSTRVKQDYVSRCRNVSMCEGSLVNHYRHDKGENLLERLKYRSDDERTNAKQRHSIRIDGNIRNGSASYKSAVECYFNFLKDTSL